MAYGDPSYSYGKLIAREGMMPVYSGSPREGNLSVSWQDDPNYQKSQQLTDFQKKIASGQIQESSSYGKSQRGEGPDFSTGARQSAYTSYDPSTNMVTFYDPEGNVTQQGQRTASGGGLISGLEQFTQDPSKAVTNVLQPVEKTVNYIAAHPEMQLALALAVAAPFASAEIAGYLTTAGLSEAAAAATASAITSITVQVAQGVPIEKATENALVDVAVSGATSATQQQISKVITSPGVTNAITSTVSSGLATAAKGGSQADVEKAMTAGLAGSTASTIYKEAVDSSSNVISKAVGGATSGAVTGGTEGAVLGGLSSAAGALGSQLAPTPASKPTTTPTPTAALPAEQVAATPSGVPSAEDFSKLIGAAQPPTASLNTGVVSDAGTSSSVDVAGAPYLAENAPQNVQNSVPAGYHLATLQESEKLLNSGEKATTLPDGSLAWIAPNITPESLAAETLPTKTLPATQQVAGIDLIPPEVVSTTPEAAAIGIGGPTPDIAPEVAVTAPGAEESATVVRVDPSTGNALVMNPSGEVFTVTVDPSTKAGSTISIPSSKVGTGTGTGTGTGAGTGTGTGTGVGSGEGAGAGTGIGTGTGTGTSADTGISTGTGVGVGDSAGVGTGVGTVSAEEGIPRVDVYGSNTPTETAPVTELDITSESSKDQPILDLIAEGSEKTPVAEPEQPVYDYDPKAKPKPDIFTTTYLSPKTKTAAPTSALGSALGTTGLTSYRGAGEIEGTGSGKPRKKVWNEESLKLKDALGV